MRYVSVFLTIEEADFILLATDERPYRVFSRFGWSEDDLELDVQEGRLRNSIGTKISEALAGRE